MALPSSGTLTLQQVYAEFGAPDGTRLSQLVRGGAYVPNTPTNSGVPAAPPISLRDFLGAAAGSLVNINNYTITGFQYPEPNPVPPPPFIYDTAVATYQLKNDGTAHAIATDGTGVAATTDTPIAGEWAPGATGANYDVRVTLISGTLDGGGSATGVWLNLGTTRAWSHSHSSAGSSSGVIQVEIRPAGGGATLDTATITLTGSR